MVTRLSRCTLFALALWASPGCVGLRTPLDPSDSGTGGATTDARRDSLLASGDAARGDLIPDASPDLTRADARLDAAADLPRDFGPDSPLDLRRDQSPDLRPDARDLGPDLVPDLRPDARDLGPDLAPDLRPDARDLGPDLAPDLGPDLAPDLRADLLDLGNDQSPDQTASAFCAPGEDYILALGGDDALYRFDPSTLSLTRIASVSCGPAPSDNNDTTLNSMTVSPTGSAYVSNHVGDLCAIDPVTFTSRLTPFDGRTATNRGAFGMALLPDSTSAGQSLYIAIKDPTQSGGDPTLPVVPDTLARVDLSTFVTTAVGPIQSIGDAGIRGIPQVELTAGPNGELYGFAIGQVFRGENQSYLLTIDPSSGYATDVTSVNAAYDAVGFALVNWQGTFYLFLADGSANPPVATVYTYRKGDDRAVGIGTLTVSIIGAGVARCR